MNKRGTTLIETIISIFIISVVVVAFLEALNIGITGTTNLSRKTSALNLAKTEMEFVKNAEYNASAGSLDSVYRIATLDEEYVGDIINYDVSGQVSNVSANQSLQKITVNVSYLTNRQVQLVGYKAGRDDASSAPPAQGKVVTDVIEDMPFERPGGWSILCWFSADGCGTWTGYYHTFTTSTRAKISATWSFNFHNDLVDTPYEPVCGLTWGAPYIGIYEGVPTWAEGEYDGVVFRPGATGVLGSGCMPGCDCVGTDPEGDYEPIAWLPSTDCQTDLFGDESFLWTYEVWCTHTGEFVFTLTSDYVDPGIYTVLFFNGEDRISFETISASVTYVY